MRPGSAAASEEVAYIVAVARARGVRLEAVEGGAIRPSGPITDHLREEIQTHHAELYQHLTETAKLETQARALMRQESVVSAQVARKMYGSPTAGGGGAPVTNPVRGDPATELLVAVQTTLERGHAPTRRQAADYGALRLRQAIQQSREDPSYRVKVDLTGEIQEPPWTDNRMPRRQRR